MMDDGGKSPSFQLQRGGDGRKGTVCKLLFPSKIPSVLQRTSCGCCGCAQPPERCQAPGMERERERGVAYEGARALPYILLVVGIWLEISFVWLLHTRTVNALRSLLWKNNPLRPCVPLLIVRVDRHARTRRGPYSCTSANRPACVWQCCVV